MTGPFTRKMLIVAVIFGAWLPSVTPYDYNTCKGGLVARTCQNQYSSHCCMSGTHLSATCCRNSCTATWWRSSASTCKDITESMCCSTDSYAPESCCNFASYSRTSLSSVKGYFDKCTGGPTIQHCTNSLSRSCCSSGGYTSASCCRESFTCGDYERTVTCYSPTVYCCSSSQRCCDYSSYKKEEEEGESRSNGIVAGGTIGLIMVPLLGIVVPVAVLHYRHRRSRNLERARGQSEATDVFATAASNPAEVQAASPQPGSENQPPPNEHHQLPPAYQSLFPPQPVQPPPYEHHQPPAPGIHQPPPYQSQPQFQAPLTPQSPSGSNPVKSL